MRLIAIILLSFVYSQNAAVRDNVINRDECGDGYLLDCSNDGDCCSQDWVGDGFPDCEDQAWGCDLSCYDNDGGDCDICNPCSEGGPDIEWKKTFEENHYQSGYSIQEIPNNGYILIATANYGNGANYDALLIKIDNNANEEWRNTFGSIASDTGTSVKQTLDGNYIITGSKGNDDSIADYDVWLIKIDNQGQEIWSRTFGGDDNDKGYCVQLTSDGGYIITGFTYSYGNGNSSPDAWLIKVDSNGIIEWDNTFGGEGNEHGIFVEQTIDGGYIITGYTDGYNTTIDGNQDLLLIKTDSNGNEEWTRVFGDYNGDSGYSVKQTLDEGYIITGKKANFSIGNYVDIWLLKTDNNGNEEWNKTFATSGGDLGKSIALTRDGGFIIAGTHDYHDLWVIKTDFNGNEEWDIIFPAFNDITDDGYYPREIQQTSDGGYIIIGEFEGNFTDNGENIILIKLDSETFIGDLNGDAITNVSDIVLLVELVLSISAGNEPTDEQLQLGDIYPDGQLNVIDIVALVNIILDQ